MPAVDQALNEQLAVLDMTGGAWFVAGRQNPHGRVEGTELGLDTVEELVRQSEIDFRTLRMHLREALTESSQITVGQLLDKFPAEQGFGSVVGYVALGAKHGELTTETELVRWLGSDGKQRQARVPAIHFVRESMLELFND